MYRYAFLFNDWLLPKQSMMKITSGNKAPDWETGDFVEHGTTSSLLLFPGLP